MIQKYTMDEDSGEPWCCCWNLSEPNTFYVGTKRGRVVAYDTRTSPEAFVQISFVQNRLPIITICHVPRVDQGRGTTGR